MKAILITIEHNEKENIVNLAVNNLSREDANPTETHIAKMFEELCKSGLVTADEKKLIKTISYKEIK